MTGDITSITIINLDNSAPGSIGVTLAETLRCGGCGQTGPHWIIPLTPTPTTPAQTDRPRRRHDPGG